jgi:hypothetical protein
MTFADPSATGPMTGSCRQPYDTVAAACDSSYAGVVILKPGTYDKGAKVLITKATIFSPGTAVIR